jgi:hypothetical protein
LIIAVLGDNETVGPVMKVNCANAAVHNSRKRTANPRFLDEIVIVIGLMHGDVHHKETTLTTKTKFFLLSGYYSCSTGAIYRFLGKFHSSPAFSDLCINTPNPDEQSKDPWSVYH